MTTSVWIKLYIGKDDQNPNVFEIYDEIRNVSHLREKIKEKTHPGLDYHPPHELRVYPKQCENDESLPWEKDVEQLGHRIKMNSEVVPGDNENLIVLAKGKEQSNGWRHVSVITVTR